MPGISGKHIVILLVSLTVVAAACAPKVRYSILSTIFDGVPPPVEHNILLVGDTLGQKIDSARLAVSKAVFTPVYKIIHEPYREKECASCHIQEQMGKLVVEEPQLCYQCHDSNNEKHSFKHGPAGAGYCTSCHRPHVAETKYLLLNEGEEFCYNCHDRDVVTKNSIHDNIKKDDCLDCHNPHSSENRFVLQKKACYKCHEDTTGDYSFLHGPVSGDYCSTCHGSHSSGNENLLVQTGQDLCLNCHDSSNVFRNVEHQGMENKNCTQCHNPHGGENEFMLN